MKCPKCGFEGNKPYQKRCISCDAILTPEASPAAPAQPAQESPHAEDSSSQPEEAPVFETPAPVDPSVSQPPLDVEPTIPTEVEATPSEPHDEVQSVEEPIAPAPSYEVEPPIPAREPSMQSLMEEEVTFSDEPSFLPDDDPSHGYGDAPIDYEGADPQKQTSSVPLTAILIVVAAIVSLAVGAMLYVMT